YAVKLDKSMTTIAYRGTAPAMNDLIAGTIDVMCDQTTNTTQQIEGGRIKAFAVTTAKPLSDHPTLKHYPSLQEMGLRDFNLTIWHGLYAPRGTPEPVLKRLNEALRAALRDPDFIQKQKALGAIVAGPSDKRITPEGHKAFVASEMAKIKTVVDAAGQYAD
ncbi:MAG: tripartite tricarboxylate transporter substrate-binding protein, partial [Tepidimonas sp.]|uniref:tripartite tricarboxylate transporter substrate-binding protein n=1 Tax=Tepidimonas sp. TaxID=2002775 RepID=UPI0040552392